MHRSLGVSFALCCFALASLADAAVVDSIFGGRVPCVEGDGFQFCEGDLGHRVESWDGVPLDVNVTLPPADVDGPFPLIIDLHGWGGGKAGAPAGSFAEQGYVWMSFTARGFHASCGSEAAQAPDPSLSDPNVCATRGWTHLGDTRYEGRDAQYLAGLLADEGIVLPKKIGVTGISYGGGRSMILGALRNRVMLPDGSLIPWQSPGGLDMEIAAAAPMIPWSDLAYALAPSGTMLDYRAESPYGIRSGVAKEEWNAVLFLGGDAAGYYAPKGTDPGADLIGWHERTMAGEPYDADPASQALITELTSFHSAYYIDDSVPPAPMMIYNAWTDDLFPGDEALRFFLKTRARHPDAEIAVHLADGFGHPRAGLGSSNIGLVFERSAQLFARHLKDSGDQPLRRVEAYTQACGASTLQGPFFADEWDAIHPGEVRFADATAHTVTERSGDVDVAKAVGPTAGGPCREIDAADDPTAVTHRLPAVGGDGYTLMGSPTVIARLAVSGVEYAQLNARLWDVAPDGTQALVTHAVYRPRGDDPGPQPFQLHPNGWEFVAGHTPKLELTGRSAPSAQASSGAFSIIVSDLELRLPVMEAPDGAAIQSPASVVLPVDAAEPPPCPPAPAGDCGVATRSTILLAHGKTDDKDKLVWRWKGGEADVETDGGASLCLYDGAGTLLVSAPAPSTGTCGDAACWKEKGAKDRYRDGKTTRTGVRSLVVRDGSKTKLALMGKGLRLGLPATPIEPLPLTVQLVDGTGACWGTSYESPKKNDEKKLKAGS